MEERIKLPRFCLTGLSAPFLGGPLCPLGELHAALGRCSSSAPALAASYHALPGPSGANSLPLPPTTPPPTLPWPLPCAHKLGWGALVIFRVPRHFHSGESPAPGTGVRPGCGAAATPGRLC